MNSDEIKTEENQNKEDLDAVELRRNDSDDENKRKFLSKWDKIRLFIYLVILIYSIALHFFDLSLSVTLGDFGSILTVLFYVIGSVGIKWLPFLTCVGIVLLLLNKKRFEEIDKAYFVIVCFLVVISTYLILRV